MSTKLLNLVLIKLTFSDHRRNLPTVVFVAARAFAKDYGFGLGARLKRHDPANDSGFDQLATRSSLLNPLKNAVSLSVVISIARMRKSSDRRRTVGVEQPLTKATVSGSIVGETPNLFCSRIQHPTLKPRRLPAPAAYCPAAVME
jgi:hypothetical protein